MWAWRHMPVITVLRGSRRFLRGSWGWGQSGLHSEYSHSWIEKPTPKWGTQWGWGWKCLVSSFSIHLTPDSSQPQKLRQHLHNSLDLGPRAQVSPDLTMGTKATRWSSQSTFIVVKCLCLTLSQSYVSKSDPLPWKKGSIFKVLKLPHNCSTSYTASKCGQDPLRLQLTYFLASHNSSSSLSSSILPPG